MEKFLDYIKNFYSNYKYESILVSIAFFITIASITIYFLSEFSSNTVIKITESKQIQSKKTILVDIEGAVSKPDIYEIDENKHLKDLISMAGGLTNNADQYFFSRHFNLAAKLHDQEKIYVPSLQESETGSEKNSSNENPDEEKVNINSASQEQLDGLAGIGPTSADKIISSRPYSSVDELVSKKILGKSVYEKIKDQLTL